MIDFSKKTVLQLKQTALRNSTHDIQAIDELENRGIKVEFAEDIKLLRAELISIHYRENGNKYRETLYNARCNMVRAMQALKEPLKKDVQELENEVKSIMNYSYSR